MTDIGCDPVDGVLVVLSSNQLNIATFVHQMGDVCVSHKVILHYTGCSDGYFGENCARQCNCLNGVINCNKRTGQCILGANGAPSFSFNLVSFVFSYLVVVFLTTICFIYFTGCHTQLSK